jgi:hypothetical protein
MNYEQLVDATEDLCKFGGYNLAEEPHPDFASFVNLAYNQLSSEVEYNWEEFSFSTVVGQAEYTDTGTFDLTPNWIRITDLWWGDSTPIVQTDLATLRKIDYLWKQASNAQSWMWIPIEPGVIRLFPPPSSVATINGFGSRAKGPLTTGQIPTFPSKFHDALPLRAAWLILRRNATGTSYQRAVAYRDEANEIIGKFKTEVQDQKAVIFQRRVSRQPAERLLLSGQYPWVW